MTRRVLIIGSGKRVKEAALPAFLRLPEHFSVEAVVARSAKTIEVEGREFPVTPLSELAAATFAEFDLIYMVVAKHAVPSVLAFLQRFDRSQVELLIDTPVLLFKHMGRLARLEGYRATWVSEDCTTLPVWDVVEAFQAQAGVGPLTSAHFDRSAYAYHGLAMGRRVLGGERVLRARRKRGPSGERRSIGFDNGTRLTVDAPRDYSLGRMTLEGPRGRISDDPSVDAELLTPILAGARLSGFRIGDVATELSPVERSLIDEPAPDGVEQPGVTTWMEGMKRVGFLRLLERIAAGAGAYPLAHALEDTIVDYHLERLGRFLPTPLSDPRRAPARGLLALLARLKGN